MKVIDLYRHSTKIGTGNTELSPEGIELAKHIGATKLRGNNYTNLFTSPLSRTIETLNAFSVGAGDFNARTPQTWPLHTQVSEHTDAMSLWSGICHKAEQEGKDMMRAVLENETNKANFVAKEGARAFKTWEESLPDGARVLVVGHSPFLELIAFGLFEKQLPQLQFCQGFRIESEDGSLKLEAIS